MQSYFLENNKTSFPDKIVMQQLYYRRYNSAIANIFNEFFSNIVPNLQIIENEDILINTIAIDDPIKWASSECSQN